MQYLIDPRGPITHAGPNVAPDDIALRDVGSSLARLQRPGERAVHSFHLQRTERAAQPQSLPGRGVDDSQVLHGAAILQTLAKAAAGFEIEAEVCGILRESMRRAPPLGDLAQRAIDSLGRRLDHYRVDNLETVGRDRIDLGLGEPDWGRAEENRRKDGNEGVRHRAKINAALDFVDPILTHRRAPSALQPRDDARRVQNST